MTRAIVLTNKDKANVDEIMECIERLQRAERAEYNESKARRGRESHPTTTLKSMVITMCVSPQYKF